MKVYLVKQPEGAYDSYTETIVKVFIDKKKAVNYVKEENSKKPLEQSKKCEDCEYKWCYNEKIYKSKPSCFMGDGEYCEPYFEKYRDVQEMFYEEYEVEDFADYTKQVRKEVCEEIKDKLKLKEKFHPEDDFEIDYDFYYKEDVEEVLDQIQEDRQ